MNKVHKSTKPTEYLSIIQPVEAQEIWHRCSAYDPLSLALQGMGCAPRLLCPLAELGVSGSHLPAAEEWKDGGLPPPKCAAGLPRCHTPLATCKRQPSHPTWAAGAGVGHPQRGIFNYNFSSSLSAQSRISILSNYSRSDFLPAQSRQLELQQMQKKKEGKGGGKKKSEGAQKVTFN